MSFFISFEGIDGCGKTTQITLLDDYLKGRGFQVLLTREPGGTDISESIRQILLHSKNTAMKPLSELLLYYAARHQNLHQRIIPALESGSWVLCDRFADASMAYQGFGRGLDCDFIELLNRKVVGQKAPDRTFLLDIDPRVSLTRANRRNSEAAVDEGRFEKESLDFFNRVRQGYLSIAEKEPQRMRVIDGSRGIDAIHAEIVEALAPLIEHATRTS